MKNFLEILSLKGYYQQLPADDVVDRQRFILFRILSMTGPIVCIALYLKAELTISGVGMMPLVMLGLGVVILINYFLAPKVNRLRLSYVLLLASSVVVMHVVSYSCGGIRASAAFYFCVIILYAYMLLGRTGGLVFTMISFAHMIYMYIISTYTNWTSYDLLKNNVALIQEDFLTDGVLVFFLIASHSNYLQSQKNVIVQGLEHRRQELENRNAQLSEMNTVLKDYASSLSKSNSELEKFAYVASHDLKAPLRAIGTVADIIEEEVSDISSEETKANFEVIRQRVQRMENLINALLNYSKVNRDNGNESTVQIDQLITEVLPVVNPGNKVPVKISADAIAVVTDKLKLKQVITNLVSNAICHNENMEPEIEFDARECDDEFVFSVKDNGHGIDPRFHERIFVIFQTLKSRDEQEHMGVGLSISKKIVEELGGRIWIESEPGKGTGFHFTIPKTKRGKYKHLHLKQIEKLA